MCAAFGQATLTIPGANISIPLANSLGMNTNQTAQTNGQAQAQQTQNQQNQQQQSQSSATPAQQTNQQNQQTAQQQSNQQQTQQQSQTQFFNQKSKDIHFDFKTIVIRLFAIGSNYVNLACKFYVLLNPLENRHTFRLSIQNCPKNTFLSKTKKKHFAYSF